MYSDETMVTLVASLLVTGAAKPKAAESTTAIDPPPVALRPR